MHRLTTYADEIKNNSIYRTFAAHQCDYRKSAPWRALPDSCGPNFLIMTEIFMSMKNTLPAFAAAALLSGISMNALADEHVYSEGPVVNTAHIRTVDGKFEDYMNWLGTTWKKEQEAAKKAGYILSYEVLTVEPRGPDDPDVILRITYKNWAALDGATAKGDAIAKQIEGSVDAANKSEADRGKIRRVLGSSTMQVLQLK
jgi:hypothetical protein